MSSPTQRSLKKLRDEGYKAEVTEHWNQWAKIRQDLFGFVDILAIKHKDLKFIKYNAVEGEKPTTELISLVTTASTLGVQTTSYSNISARVKKIKESEMYPILKKAGWGIQVHGWRKVGSRWECKVVEL